MDSDFDLDFEMAPETVRVAAPSIPPEAIRDHHDARRDLFDDEPTLVVVPSAIAALAERSAMTTPAAHPRRSRAEEEDAMRRAVIGIWALAAVLLATLGILVR
jgi:hypothetical protein